VEFDTAVKCVGGLYKSGKVCGKGWYIGTADKETQKAGVLYNRDT